LRRAAESFPLVLAKAQDIRPTARTGVADASAISNQLHVFQLDTR
jgi:hypothetical protein